MLTVLELIGLSPAGAMSGPYPFLRVYDQPIWTSACWFVAIAGGAYLVALAIAWAQLSLCKGD